MGPFDRSDCPATVSGRPGSHRKGRGSHTTTRCSTASSRTRDAGTHAPGGSESSSPPSLECTRNIGLSGRPQSTAPSRAEWDDTGNHLCDGPGPMTSKYLLERAQQRCSLLGLRGAQRHPSAAMTANPTELKAQK